MKKYREYFLVFSIVLGIVLIIMALKGVYPFGINSFMYSDGAFQQTPFLYYLYDVIKNGQSFFMDLNTSGGMNFLGNFFYYLFSPINFLIVFFSRIDIFKAVSIIILIKSILSGLTSLYMLRKIFPKLNSLERISLSILYVFSGYFFNYYIITSWMDTMWILPLIVTGIYNIIKNNNYKLYFITLLLSLIMCFYTSALLLIFILLLYFVYIKFFNKEKSNEKLTILSSITVLALMCSAFVLVPSIMSVLDSFRAGLDLGLVISTPIGLILDKIGLFLPMGILTTLFLALLIYFKKKKDKRSFRFLVLVSALILIPVLFEPINKMLHLGSYFMFPLRYGFIYSIIFTLSGAYFLNKYQGNNNNIWFKIIAVIGLLAVPVLSYKYAYLFGPVLNSLTLYTDKKVFVILLLFFVITSVVTLTIINFKKRPVYLFLLTIISSISLSYCYLGVDSEFEYYNSHYNDYYLVQQIIKNDNGKIKNTNIDDDFNYGDIMNYKSDYSFSSLNGKSAVEALAKLGYTRKSNIITTSGSTLFTDILLGYNYTLSFKDKEIGYTPINIKLDNYYLHKLSNKFPFGFIINKTNFSADNPFELQNELYRSITNDESNLLDVADITNLEFNYNADSNKIFYLNITSNSNDPLYNSYNNYDIYINDSKYIYNEEKGYNVPGILELGAFDGIINIKIVPLKEQLSDKITFAVLDTTKLEKLKENADDISYDGKTFKVKNKEDGKYFFIPINALDGVKVKNNDKEVEVVKVLDNYIGIKLENGLNSINISYESPGLKIGIIISIISLLISVILIYKNNLIKIISFLNKFPFISYFYHILVVLVILGVYLLPFIGFILYLI